MHDAREVALLAARAKSLYLQLGAAKLVFQPEVYAADRGKSVKVV
jgi:hypothetical protein